MSGYIPGLVTGQVNPHGPGRPDPRIFLDVLTRPDPTRPAIFFKALDPTRLDP